MRAVVSATRAGTVCQARGFLGCSSERESSGLSGFVPAATIVVRQLVRREV